MVHFPNCGFNRDLYIYSCSSCLEQSCGIHHHDHQHISSPSIWREVPPKNHQPTISLTVIYHIPIIFHGFWSQWRTNHQPCQQFTVYSSHCYIWGRETCRDCRSISSPWKTRRKTGTVRGFFDDSLELCMGFYIDFILMLQGYKNGQKVHLWIRLPS